MKIVNMGWEWLDEVSLGKGDLTFKRDLKRGPGARHVTSCRESLLGMAGKGPGSFKGRKGQNDMREGESSTRTRLEKEMGVRSCPDLALTQSLPCFWLAARDKVKCSHPSICGLIAHLGGWRKRDQDSEGSLRIQQGRGEWVWPNWGNWGPTEPEGQLQDQRCKKGQGWEPRRQSERQKAGARQRKVRGATTSIVNCLSAGWKIFWRADWTKAQGDCCASRNMLEAVRSPLRLSHSRFLKQLWTVRCKPQLEENRCWTRWRTVVCWWCSGQRKPPLIWSTQGETGKEKERRWALEVMTNLETAKSGQETDKLRSRVTSKNTPEGGHCDFLLW